jgi:hypothetical protein
MVARFACSAALGSSTSSTAVGDEPQPRAASPPAAVTTEVHGRSSWRVTLCPLSLSMSHRPPLCPFPPGMAHLISPLQCSLQQRVCRYKPVPASLWPFIPCCSAAAPAVTPLAADDKPAATETAAASKVKDLKAQLQAQQEVGCRGPAERPCVCERRTAPLRLTSVGAGPGGG